MKIGVLIPIVQTKYVKELIPNLLSGKKVPDEIIIVDNTSDGFYPSDWPIQIQVLRGNKWGVNESWNRAASVLARDGVDIISFLNDDLVLNREFLWKVELGFHTSYASVLCPITVPTKKMVPWSEGETMAIEKMTAREGWAFSMLTEMWKRCPLIPSSSLKTFCGDDWFWYHTHKKSGWWGRMNQNNIFHYIGGSLRGTKIRDTMRYEKRVFVDNLLK
jgi:glycosyltransferase involved in cell wall biosynthesis